MSCDHKLITEHASDYVEGRLPDYLKKQCDEVLQHCQYCQQSVAGIYQITRLAEGWNDQQVPEWSRVAHAVRPPVRYVSWPNWAAMACSLLAVLLVVFRFEVRLDDGLTISFGGNQQQEQLQTLLAQELQSFAAQQNETLDERLEEYMEFQDLNNQVVLNDWLELNDLNFLLTGWQSQRLQDSRRVNQQLDILTENQIDNNTYLNQLIRNVGLNERGNL